MLELVEGPTLADRIAQGPIPLDEALPIARQIAEALEAAHEQGVVHRDLKPANVKIRPTAPSRSWISDWRKRGSRVPELRLLISRPRSPPAAHRRGFILGTAAYMRPEQAGQPSDKRSDIWAFGSSSTRC